MLAWEIWPFLQAASSIGVLKKAYLLRAILFYPNGLSPPERVVCFGPNSSHTPLTQTCFFQNQPLGIQEQNSKFA